MPADEVTYESIKGRLYKERKALHILTKLDGDFYAQAERHLRELQEEYRREQSSNPTSPKTMVLHDELWNLQRVREDLYELRERKIVAAALTSAKGGNPERTSMTADEIELYEQLARTLKDARRRMLKRALAGAEPAPAPVGTVAGEPVAPVPPASRTPPADPPGAEATEAAEAPLGPPERRGSGRVFVEPVEDLPAFTAPDLRTYRLRKGDLAAVPAEVARALAGAGKVHVHGG